ncbi:MAG TPA: response regulator transcription factor [Puia sp.]|jgi:DNA-binding response OmpR family regulator|nr:response regulator transcription factor [Puia sp.]
MKNILLVEDDPQITNLLSLHLHEPFYRVTACDRAATALEKLAVGSYDLVILDIMLPDLSGVEICRRIREQNGRTPILMLSSLSEETDKVLALELGADDYLTKPFGIFELMARVKALLRRENGVILGEAAAMGAPGVGAAGVTGGADGGPVMVAGQVVRKDLVIDRDKHKVTVRGQRLELTPKEFDLLWLLASHPGKTFTRHELLEMIWGFAFQEYEHTVTSHINRLRIKLEKNLNKPEYILTTWGTGYRFAE